TAPMGTPVLINGTWYKTKMGVPPALPGCQQKFEIYGSSPAIRSSILGQLCTRQEFEGAQPMSIAQRKPTVLFHVRSCEADQESQAKSSAFGQRLEAQPIKGAASGSSSKAPAPPGDNYLLHRARALQVRQRTMLATALHAHLAEFGIMAPHGIHRVEKLAA